MESGDIISLGAERKRRTEPLPTTPAIGRKPRRPSRVEEFIRRKGLAHPVCSVRKQLSRRQLKRQAECTRQQTDDDLVLPQPFTTSFDSFLLKKLLGKF